MSAAAFAVPLMMTAPVRSDDMTESRVEWHMENWAEWQLAKHREGGYSSRASGNLASGYGYSRSFDAMVAEADKRCAIAVEAILDDLPLPQQHAVHNKHLAACFAVRGSIEEHYQSARRTIKVGLMRRGIP